MENKDDQNQEIFEEVGRLAAESNDLKEEIEGCEEAKEATFNLITFVAKILKRILVP